MIFKKILPFFSKFNNQDNSYYALIDLCRGIAAISVVIFHYKFFSLSNEQKPFYDFLKIFYEHGLYAVHFFWAISGSG